MGEHWGEAAVRSADELAVVRPSGQVRIARPLLEVLYARIAAAGDADRA